MFHRFFYQAPGQRYAKGFNTEMGDTGVLLKLKWDVSMTQLLWFVEDKCG